MGICNSTASPEVAPPSVSLASAISSAMLDDDVRPRQEVDVAEHVTLYGDDVRILSFDDCADVAIHLHRHGRPIGRGTNCIHWRNAESVDPHVQLVPGGLRMEL